MIPLPIYSFLLVPVFLSAAYCVMVCTCVAGRMTRDTNGLIRWPVLILGALAAWAILRTVAGGWQLDWTAVVHAIAVVAGAAVLAAAPRIPT